MEPSSRLCDIRTCSRGHCDAGHYSSPTLILTPGSLIEVRPSLPLLPQGVHLLPQLPYSSPLGSPPQAGLVVSTFFPSTVLEQVAFDFPPFVSCFEVHVRSAVGSGSLNNSSQEIPPSTLRALSIVCEYIFSSSCSASIPYRPLVPLL